MWLLLLEICVIMEQVGRLYGEMWNEFNQRRNASEKRLGWQDSRRDRRVLWTDVGRQRLHLQQPRKVDERRKLATPGQGVLSYETPCPDDDNSQLQEMSIADLTITTGVRDSESLNVNVPLTLTPSRDSDVQPAESSGRSPTSGLRRIGSRIFGTLKRNGKGAN